MQILTIGFQGSSELHERTARSSDQTGSGHHRESESQGWTLRSLSYFLTQYIISIEMHKTCKPIKLDSEATQN